MIGQLLTTLLDVWRDATADDGAGGRTTTPTLAGTVRARISQPTAVEQVVARQAGSRHDHHIYLLPTVDVRRGDVLRPHGATAGSRPYYDVISVIEPSEPAYRRADVELVQTEA